MMLFWSFIFPETFIYYRGYFNLNSYIGKKVQTKFSYGVKNLVNLGIRKKIEQVGRFLILHAKLLFFEPVFSLFE